MPRGKRKPNEFFEVATVITDIMNPAPPDSKVYKSVLAMNMAHLSLLCNPDKADGDKVFPPGIVLAAWKRFRTQLLENGYAQPNVSALRKEQRVEQYLKAVIDEMPPVYLSKSHDDYVRKHAETLRHLGFKSGGWLEPEDQYSGDRIP